jgi:hypothetical protein
MNGADGSRANLFETVAGYATSFRDTVGKRPQRAEMSYPEALQAFEAPTPESGTPLTS